MANLCFKGPYHFDHIVNLGLNRTPGIYIWGFMFDDAINTILDFNNGYSFPQTANTDGVKTKINSEIKNTNGNAVDCQFVPYYVGLAANLESRLTQHNDIREGDSLKKTRLFDNYYNSFFLDFPIKIGNSNRNILTFVLNNKHRQTIEYFNDNDVLDVIYNKAILTHGKKGHWPIHKQFLPPKNEIYDSLYDIIHFKNNFWFCYAELDGETKEEYLAEKAKNPRTSYLEPHEAQTFYSLKGKTISKTKPFQATGFGHTIIDNTKCNIFKCKNGVIDCNNVFNGY